MANEHDADEEDGRDDLAMRDRIMRKLRALRG